MFLLQNRLDLIRVYCLAVNKEYIHNRVTIRIKPVFPLSEFSKHVLPSVDAHGDFKMPLLPLTLDDPKRFYNVHGLLILKTDDGEVFLFIIIDFLWLFSCFIAEQSFYSTFETRRIIYVHMSFTFEEFLRCIKEDSA